MSTSQATLLKLAYQCFVDSSRTCSRLTLSICRFAVEPVDRASNRKEDEQTAAAPTQ